MQNCIHGVVEVLVGFQRKNIIPNITIVHRFTEVQLQPRR